MLHGTDTDIRTAIQNATAEGRHLLRISGDYTISETILLPSGFTLILEDCALTMADGVMTQMFRNERCPQDGVLPAGGVRTLSDCDSDIHLLGVGRAILDGGVYNGLSERNSLKNGNPHISRNNLLLFCNVDGFSVENITVRNQRWWALNFLFCRRGVLRNIDFCADDTRIDENGNRVHGLLQSSYESVCVKNADGIDLRAGCHDFLIENITGFCEDDIVALTDLPGKLEEMFGVRDAPRDIYNVVIRNVRGCSYCSMIRLLNQSGAKMHNILIDGVFDASKDSLHMDRGIFGVRVGDTHLYGPEQPKDENMDSVAVRNVYVRTRCAIQLAGGMTNVTTENINGFDGCSRLVQDDRT